MRKLTLGKQLRIAFIEHDKTQREIIRATNIPAGTFSEIVNDWRVPSAEQLAKICSAIGIEPADIDEGGP